MLRQVVIPSEKNSTISIPAEFYGTEVEILMFPSSGKEDNEKKKRVEELKALFAPYQFDFGDYKFDRNEANNYE